MSKRAYGRSLSPAARAAQRNALEAIIKLLGPTAIGKTPEQLAEMVKAKFKEKEPNNKDG